ncbi:MAG: GTPase HflX [Clostridia bacterium]|jgi:GTP-binding protein HflX
MYDFEATTDGFVPVEIAEKLAVFTTQINREIAVYMDRRGKIHSISIGDNATVSLPEIEERTHSSRLSGIRCIHTHPNSDGMLSNLDLRSLLTLGLDSIIALGVKNSAVIDVYVALPTRNDSGILDSTETFGPFKIGDLSLDDFFDSIKEIDKSYTNLLYKNSESSDERAILISGDSDTSLDELEELAKTANVEVLKKVLQKNATKNSALFIGKGMAENLRLLCQSMAANVVIFDDELSGMQVRNLEEIVGVKIIDRTVLILDIFANRAGSKEGKLQVELAQLKYNLPRLMGVGASMSRLGGGIGTRGPGEKKLEVDRRNIKRRILFLETELKGVSKRRNFLREGRRKKSLPVVSLVGYTNAGKSTLLNKLSGSDVFVEDKLFATLDPTARGFKLPDGREILIIDTVGFIRKLPHELINAFKSTLEEAVYADLLLHIVDASSNEADEQIKVVNELLDSMGVLNKPIITVFNKLDLANNKSRPTLDFYGRKPVEISATTGFGIEKLVSEIEDLLPEDEIELNLFIPFNSAKTLNYIHENSKILSKNYTEDGVEISMLISKNKVEKINKFIKN